MKRSRWVTTSTCLLLCVLTHSGVGLATVTDPLTTINLDQPVYFLAPDGSPVVTPSYTRK